MLRAFHFLPKNRQGHPQGTLILLWFCNCALTFALIVITVITPCRKWNQTAGLREGTHNLWLLTCEFLRAIPNFISAVGGELCRAACLRNFWVYRASSLNCIFQWQQLYFCSVVQGGLIAHVWTNVILCLGGPPGPKNVWLWERQAFHRLKFHWRSHLLSRGSLKAASWYIQKCP
jgi:hypothetical protein